MNIELITSATDNTLTIALKGELDALACNQIRPEFEFVANDSTRKNVALDLGQVSFLDSSGIGSIVFLFKRLRVQGYELTLVNVQGQPKELITLLRINSAISVEFASAEYINNKEAEKCSA